MEINGWRWITEQAARPTDNKIKRKKKILFHLFQNKLPKKQRGTILSFNIWPKSLPVAGWEDKGQRIWKIWICSGLNGWLEMRLPWEQQPEDCSDVDNYLSHHNHKFIRTGYNCGKAPSGILIWIVIKLQWYKDVSQITNCSDVSMLNLPGNFFFHFVILTLKITFCKTPSRWAIKVFVHSQWRYMWTMNDTPIQPLSFHKIEPQQKSSSSRKLTLEFTQKQAPFIWREHNFIQNLVPLF